jgi:UDP-N-acetylmuramate--alanine ligase
MDFYQSMDDLMTSFLSFINKVPFHGLSVLCLDHPNVRALLPKVRKRFATYGLSAEADFYARDLEIAPMETRFSVWHRADFLGRLKLRLPGRHSATNALAAVAVGTELEIPFAEIAGALEAFTGIHRRFELKGEVRGITVIDDYGHHPEEIRATLQAVREGWKRPLTVIFQPHRYTRTRDLFEEFLSAFEGADRLVLTEIYAAGEEPLPGVCGEALYQALKRKGHLEVEFIPDKEEIVQRLLPKLKPNDIVLTLGAGDIYKAGEKLVEALGR